MSIRTSFYALTRFVVIDRSLQPSGAGAGQCRFESGGQQRLKIPDYPDGPNYTSRLHGR